MLICLVFQILRIDGDSVKVAYDLRENLKSRDFEKIHSVTCVAWGRGEFRRHIALSTSGGQILLYDIDKQTSYNPNNAKSVLRLHDSNRAVNGLIFSPSNGSLMLSASGDGSVRLYDLRNNKKRPSYVFTKPGDITREVQCSPFDATKFAAIYDSGAIQTWDFRNPSVCSRRINAHSGTGLSLDWHPEYDYIVSGGRDKQIQIWNMASESRKPEHVILSSSPVAKVRWQFDLQHSNASSSYGVLNTDIVSFNMSLYDNNIYVWNPRRPYIPRYVVEAHSNSVTDVFWRSNKTLWSISKDKTFMQHNLENRDMEISSMPMQAISWNHENHLSFVIQDRHEDQYIQKTDEENTENVLEVRKKHSIKAPLPSPAPPAQKMPYQDQAIFTVTFPGYDPDAFKFCAQNYIYYDAPHPRVSDTNRLPAICRHNALISSHAGKFRAAQTWEILGKIIESEKENFFKFAPTKQPIMGSRQQFNSRIAESFRNSIEATPALHPVGDNSSPKPPFRSRDLSVEESRQVMAQQSIEDLNEVLINTDIKNSPSTSALSSSVNSSVATNELDPSSYETSSSPEESRQSQASGSNFTQLSTKNATPEKEKRFYNHLPEIKEGVISSTNRSSYNNLPALSLTDQKLNCEPGGAIHNIPINKTFAIPARNSVLSALDESYVNSPTASTISRKPLKFTDLQSSLESSEEVYVKPERIIPREVQPPPLTSAEVLKKRYREYLKTLTHPWRAEKMIEQAAIYYMEQGDIQMCTTLGLLFMDDYPDAFETHEMLEEWFWTYLTLMRKNELHTVCAELIKEAPFPKIRETGQVETSLDMLCHRCKHPLTDNVAAARQHGKLDEKDIAFWYCENCHRLLDGCIFCRLPVKGMAVTIFECGHKLHPECLDQWIVFSRDEDNSDEDEDEVYEKSGGHTVYCPSGCQTIIATE